MGKVRLPDELIAKDYAQRGKVDVQLWMVREFDVRRDTKVIKDDLITEHIQRVKKLTGEGTIVGCKFDGLSYHKVDEYVIERLMRGYYQELVEKKVIWIEALIAQTIKRIIVKVNNTIKKEFKR